MALMSMKMFTNMAPIQYRPSEYFTASPAKPTRVQRIKKHLRKQWDSYLNNMIILKTMTAGWDPSR